VDAAGDPNALREVHALESEAFPGSESTVSKDRRRLIFLIASSTLFMSSVDQTIVATALPTIQRELHAQVNWSSWLITIYALGQVLVMPLAGRLSDQYGRKRVFLCAIALFTTASLCCGMADNIYELVALRALQSIGGGAFLPSASGVVSDQFGPDRDRALGLFSSIFPIGGVIGPILGGIFIAVWSWRGIFLVNVPIGIVLFVLAVRFIPHSEPTRPGRNDFGGVLLLGWALLSAMFGIAYLGSGTAQITSPIFLVCESMAVLAAILFVRHTKRHPSPFIPARFLTGRGFGVVNIINVIFGAAALGFTALVPLYAEERYGIHALAAGTLLTARAVGMIALSGLSVMVLRKTGYRLPMVVGFIVIATGLILLSIEPSNVSPYVWLSIAAGVTGIGLGTSQPASNNASMQLAPNDIAAIAGLRGMFRQAGAIMAVSITTAILARSSDPGLAQAHVFVVFAFMLLATIPLIFLLPDHRGRW
jgi:EmrB/QacA subfamily drug resistance transporter